MRRMTHIAIVLIFMQIGLYGEVDIKNIGMDIKKCIKNENISNIKTIKKIFAYFNLNEKMLDNNYFKHEIKTALYLCKRDGKCNLQVDKVRLLKLSNAYDGRKYKFSEIEMTNIYQMMDNIDYIMNKMVDKNRKKLHSNNDSKVIQIINSKQELNYNNVFKTLPTVYNYDFLKSNMYQELEYTSTFAECKSLDKNCILKNKKKYTKNLAKRFSQDEIIPFLEFFGDIDRIKKNLLSKRENNNKIKRVAFNKQKAKKTQARQIIFDSLNNKSQKLGYKGYQEGLENLLFRLKNGFTSFETEKKYIYGLSPKDNFIVNGIVGNYIIYIKQHNPEIKIAIIKKSGELYQDGTYLDSDIFVSLQEIKEFRTRFGDIKQVIVFKRINFH